MAYSTSQQKTEHHCFLINGTKCFWNIFVVSDCNIHDKEGWNMYQKQMHGERYKGFFFNVSLNSYIT